jgi:guanylate kinase
LSDLNDRLQSPSREPPTSPDGYHGSLFVVSSPSGGGKGTLIQRVLNEIPGVSYSVSWTTRDRRPGEVDGINYHFVTVEEFERMRDAGGFLESAVVHGHLYGTARKAVEQELQQGRDIILEIDVQGAELVRKSIPSVIGVFILPPAFEILKARLKARMTERPEELEVRLVNSRSEVERYKEFDYVVLNDDIDRASTQLASIIRAERARREKQEWLAQTVLATFRAVEVE